MKRIFCLLAAAFAVWSSATFAAEPRTSGIVCEPAAPYSVELPSPSPFAPTSFSVAAWAKTTTPAAPQVVLSVGAPSRFFTFYLYKGAFRMLVEKDGAANEYSFALAPAPEANVWTHYCGTFDGETICVYRNGEVAARVPMKTQLPADAFAAKELNIGSDRGQADRVWRGELTDVAIWNRVLSAADVASLFENGAADSALASGRVALWNGSSVVENGARLVPVGGEANGAFVAVRKDVERLLNQKDSGYRGIWYYNQKLANEYKYKYSGGLGTYPANHYPFAVYRPEVDKTFFCFGGTESDANKTLWHEVGVFDHKTGKVSRPTIIVDKETNDAHDNPVISVDDSGRIWVFSTSHGTGRPSYVWRSANPYDITTFEKVDATKIVDGAPVPMTNFSYFQVWNVPRRGFAAFFTTYDRAQIADVAPETQVQRILAFATSPDGVSWSRWRPFAAVEIGHYQNACVFFDREKNAEDGAPATKFGTAFNYHPQEAKGNRGVGLNWRTNLYYMESADLGENWRAVDGTPVEIPLLNAKNPALVRDFEAENLNVYVVDLVYDAQGSPIIAFVTSKGFESGLENGPREFCVARWSGASWDFSVVGEVDNNYDFGSLYVDESDDGVLRLVGALDDGPQRFNTGGEAAQYVSRDFGKTWEKDFQLTQNSELNQCFPRRPIDAHPGFYAIWADGDGRKPSISNIYFSTKDGAVYRLPREMKEDWETPIRVN